jgi:hypothetical protein
MSERRRLERKDFSYYMRLIDHDTGELVGHLTDISTGGFKLDSQKPIPIEKDFKFRMDLTGDVANKPSMVFIARCKWCEVDPLDPFLYNVGFQLINIAPSDIEVFQRMMEKYGTKSEGKPHDPRRSNRW